MHYTSNAFEVRETRISQKASHLFFDKCDENTVRSTIVFAFPK